MAWSTRVCLLRYCGALLCFVPLVVALLARDRLDDDANAAIVKYSNYIGDASFAITGGIAAASEGMDVFGSVVVGYVTALGGGMSRDILIGRLPVWWLTAWDEALECVLVGIVTFGAWPRLVRRWGLTTSAEFLFWTDTLGIAVFTANGALIGATHTFGERGVPQRLHLAGAALCGMATATFGGLTRDVLINRPVRILHSMQDLYALPAFVAGLATAATVRSAPPSQQSSLTSETSAQALLLGMALAVLLRVIAYNHDLKLPTFAKSLVADDRRYKVDASRRRATTAGGAGGGPQPLLASAENIQS